MSDRQWNAKNGDKRGQFAANVTKVTVTGKEGSGRISWYRVPHREWMFDTTLGPGQKITQTAGEGFFGLAWESQLTFDVEPNFQS